jgi:radical SAM protein with 4Fe4S-binding SPASM domain
VLAILERIQQRDPGYFQKKVVVNSSFNMSHDISSIFDYFSHGLFRDVFVRIKGIRDCDTDFYTVSEADRRRYQKGLDGLIDSYLKSLRKGAPFKFSHLYHTFPLIFEKFPRREIGPAKTTVRPNRVCVPGVQQLFVGSDGRFYTCYNFAHSGYEIGNFREGLDIQKMRRLIQAYAGYCDEMCQACWAFRLCAHCFMHTLEDGRLSQSRKMENCLRERERIAADLKRFVYIWENEAASAFLHDFSLHAIVRSCQPETEPERRNSRPARILIEDLSGDTNREGVKEKQAGSPSLGKERY